MTKKEKLLSIKTGEDFNNLDIPHSEIVEMCRTDKEVYEYMDYICRKIAPDSFDNPPGIYEEPF